MLQGFKGQNDAASIYVLHRIAIERRSCQMLAKGLYLSLEREKYIFCIVLIGLSFKS